MSTRSRLLRSICERHGITSLYSFGSRAKQALAFLAGEVDAMARGESDLDLAAEPENPGKLDARSRARLTIELEDFFGMARVDLVSLPEASAFLAADAIRGELLFCDDGDLQAEQELFYLRRAGDLAPFERIRQEGILSGELLR